MLTRPEDARRVQTGELPGSQQGERRVLIPGIARTKKRSMDIPISTILTAPGNDAVDAVGNRTRKTNAGPSPQPKLEKRNVSGLRARARSQSQAVCPTIRAIRTLRKTTAKAPLSADGQRKLERAVGATKNVSTQASTSFPTAKRPGASTEHAMDWHRVKNVKTDTRFVAMGTIVGNALTKASLVPNERACTSDKYVLQIISKSRQLWSRCGKAINKVKPKVVDRKSVV